MSPIPCTAIRWPRNIYCPSLECEHHISVMGNVSIFRTIITPLDLTFMHLEMNSTCSNNHIWSPSLHIPCGECMRAIPSVSTLFRPPLKPPSMSWLYLMHQAIYGRYMVCSLSIVCLTTNDLWFYPPEPTLWHLILLFQQIRLKLTISTL